LPFFDLWDEPTATVFPSSFQEHAEGELHC
jgi:hypothetical protein